jgi:ABC-type antimicrobial peptide transport system permease subunit
VRLPKDVAFSVRSLRRSPGFALLVIFTLALGIGANTAVFGLVSVLAAYVPARRAMQIAPMQALRTE